MTTALSLRSLLSDTALPANEARMLMAFVLDKHYQLPRSAVLSRDNMELGSNALEEWRALEAKRLEGQPIAYLIGKRGFHNIELQVAPGVLIPRPETELLVEIGLREISRLKKLPGENPSITALDLGTGSGAIALALAYDAPHVNILATDQSADALNIAKANAQALHLESHVQFSQGSWYAALQQPVRFDIILSNPPYIAQCDPHLSEGDLRFEPISALTDHSNGLSCLEEIVRNAPKYLKSTGLIAVEHGFDQSAAVVELMNAAGLTDIQTHQDLAGHFRVASGRNSS
ncbi:peptide chain release factor N(5)-glutamine methyltransferase [Polynucleobacter sp. UK-Kesae-W10]|uniref:peptide chain release factor N(5)-glutamine methyltransferase n=1 Tax=Polynucleobacter sp. UK-Kesae-W10 TaxID=1819738 RepID=UPI001C0C0928|nr:peptide chain release factor N(5)-glutamine methyltransferase [Polynucleobacter sp. UK-Kesae-W10]MBU3576754.1 peptide chain release factor N(5)-glutamine methyltransferase [Polynucleobacter sp. UK-Kesae-W10]